MRTSGLLIVVLLICLESKSAICQHSNGVEVSVGIGDTYGFSYSGEYFHPLPLSQFYVLGGVASFTQSSSNMILFQRIFLGVQIGDYLFLAPKVSYNFYPTRSHGGTSRDSFLAWGLEGGLMLHPSGQFAFGAKVSYDRGPEQVSYDVRTPIEINTMSIFLRLTPNN